MSEHPTTPRDPADLGSPETPAHDPNLDLGSQAPDYDPNVDTAMAVHSACQPGRPGPHGLGHAG